MTEPLAALAEAGRGWNTWFSEHPAQFTHLPRGLSVTPCAYAASKNAFTDFPAAGSGVRYGPRQVRGEYVSLKLSHAGTELDLIYDRPAAETLRLRCSAPKLGEWALRFWLILTFDWRREAEEPSVVWTYDEVSGALTAAHARHGAVAVVAQAPSLMATFHEDRAALRQEFETHGYFYLKSRDIVGRFPCLRYNFEETREISAAVGFGATVEEALQRASGALNAAAPPPPARLQQGRGPNALDAVRDVVGWNSVWDPINNWPYTSLSRSWVAQKFGGFGLWLDDIFHHAWLASLIDPDIARENVAAVLSQAQPAGNLPCLMTGRDSWVDRSQPPIGSIVSWMIAEHSGDSGIIDLAYDRLLANHDWWFRMRDGNGDGLFEWGTSPGVGTGLYRGTHLGARNESSMDNSPLHDEASFDAKSGTLTSADVGLNSLLVLDGAMLAHFAEQRGDAATAKRLRERSNALAARVRTQLWDEERKVFANRLWNGKFVRAIAPTSFYPLIAGIATPEQTAHLMRWLEDPRKFGGFWCLPSVTRDHPAYHDNVYWRGRVWPPLNMLTYLGLRRAGEDAAAERLAADSHRLFEQAWRKGQCPENFNAETGRADDQPDTDLFYGWGGLMPLIAALDITRLSPWNGWEIDWKPGAWRIGPLLIRGRKIELAAEAGWTTLRQDGGDILATDAAGRWSQIVLSAKEFSCRSVGGFTLRMRAMSKGDLIEARFEGQTLSCEQAGDGNGIEIKVPSREKPAELVLRWR
jgi:putative isomerase